MRLLFSLVLEYLLILKLQLVSLVRVKPPASWKNGAKNPVLIIPGFHESFWTVAKIATFLNAHGYPIYTIPNFSSTAKIEPLSKQVADFIEQNKLENIILLGHSKGGVIAKHVVCTYPEITQRVIKVIAIASPFGGTKLAALKIQNLDQLLPNSPLLSELAQNTEVNSKFLCIYPQLDNHTIPNTSALLDGAQNVELPVIGHTNILVSKLTLKELDRFLNPNPA